FIICQSRKIEELLNSNEKLMFNYDPKIFEEILNFMYGHRLKDISKENLIQLVKYGKELDYEGLIDYCFSYLESMIAMEENEDIPDLIKQEHYEEIYDFIYGNSINQNESKDEENKLGEKDS